MKPHRPKNLNLFTIRLPIPALVSILHRITGLFLFILIPFLLWALSTSLTFEGYDSMQDYFSNSAGVKFFVWLLFIPFCFHLVAGVRHLLMDIHIGDSLQGGRLSAFLTCGISILLILIVGIWLW